MFYTLYAQVRVCVSIQVQLPIHFILCAYNTPVIKISQQQQQKKQNLNKLNVYYREFCGTCLIFQKITTMPTYDSLVITSMSYYYYYYYRSPSIQIGREFLSDNAFLLDSMLLLFEKYKLYNGNELIKLFAVKYKKIIIL